MFENLKRRIRTISSTPPPGMKAGAGVQVKRPFRISAPSHITVGEQTEIGAHALITPITAYASERFSPSIEIGSGVYIGPHLYLAAIGRVVIGDRCVLSEHVYINDCSHGLDPEGGPIMEQKLVRGGDIEIGEGCFLGFRSAILPGVRLGAHCIVGINSVVTKSFPELSMVAGCPAKLIKRWCAEEKKWKLV
jgi:serine acetyltransferase